MVVAALTYALASLTPATAHDATLRQDVTTLASDQYGGRATLSTGAQLSRDYIMGRLRSAGYREVNGRLRTLPTRDGGTTILATLPGSGALASDGYLLVGAHYDHLDPVGGNPSTPVTAQCSPQVGDDAPGAICNGATDNATGVAVVMDVATHLAQSPPTSRRRVVFALWDSEENNLQGSIAYRQNELQLGRPVAYINYDIQGANLRDSLRDSTFAIGASSGGARLRNAVEDAAETATGGRPLNVHQLSEPFGQYRSDYAPFLAPKVVNNFSGEFPPPLPTTMQRVPSVFFGDGSGPCYHTTQDEVDVVDFDKLVHQADIGLRLVRDLVTGPKPAIVDLPQPVSSEFGALVGASMPGLGLHYPYPPIPPPTYADAVTAVQVFAYANGDPSLDPASQAAIDQYGQQLVDIVVRGPLFFRPIVDGTTVAVAAFQFMEPLTSGACEGFFSQ